MPPFIVPPMPPALIDALKRSYAPNGAAPAGGVPGAAPAAGSATMSPGMAPTAMAAPSPLMQPGFPGGPAAMSDAPLGNGRVPMVPYSGAPPSAPPVAPPTAPPSMKLPAVTDDPNVKNGMGEMPKTPNLGSYLNPALQQYQSDLAGYQKADQASRIDPQQVKPRLWERLLGFGLGATQLKDPQNAGAVAGEVVNRRRTGAELARSTALAPWTQRLEQDKAGVPLAESAARVAGEQGRLDLDTSKENRERFSAIKSAEAKEELNNLREEWNNERDKNNQERNANYLQHITDLEGKYKDDAAMRQELMHLRERMEDFKESKAGDKNKAKPTQFAGAEAKKAAGLQKAKTAYDRETAMAGTDPDARKTADDNFHAAQQEAQDAYEAEINALGGEATHQDVASWQKGSAAAPPAAGAPAAAAPAATNTKPAAAAEEVPTKAGPAGETPTKTASDGKTKIGFYKSTGQWMLVPQTSGPSGGK